MEARKHLEAVTFAVRRPGETAWAGGIYDLNEAVEHLQEANQLRRGHLLVVDDASLLLDGAVRWFRDGAAQAGDSEAVELCRRALGGSGEARWQVAQMILDGWAMEVEG